MSDQTHLTLGAAAQRIGVIYWQIDRLARGNRIPVSRVGRMRLVAVADLERVRQACQAAGYLPTGGAEAGA